MITDLRNHWMTILSLLTAGFLVFLSVAGFTASDPEYTTEDRVAGAVAAVGAVALTAGLWTLRSGRRPRWMGYVLIIPAVAFAGMFFWLYLVPTIVALVLLYAGVLRRGLERELTPGPSTSVGGA